MAKKRRAHIKKKRNKIQPVELSTPRAKQGGYEYIVEELPISISKEDLEVHLNSLGGEGWYLVGTGSWNSTSMRMCFVRDNGKSKVKE